MTLLEGRVSFNVAIAVSKFGSQSRFDIRIFCNVFCGERHVWATLRIGKKKLRILNRTKLLLT